jgi:hypothetical protein
MKKIFFTVSFWGFMLIFSCQRKEVVNESICLEKAKSFLKRDSNLYFKGIIYEAKIDRKNIFEIRNKEDGSQVFLDDTCNVMYSCCGHKCDCLIPLWYDKVEIGNIIWENK